MTLHPRKRLALLPSHVDEPRHLLSSHVRDERMTPGRIVLHSSVLIEESVKVIRVCRETVRIIRQRIDAKLPVLKDANHHDSPRLRVQRGSVVERSRRVNRLLAKILKETRPATEGRELFCGHDSLPPLVRNVRHRKERQTRLRSHRVASGGVRLVPKFHVRVGTVAASRILMSAAFESKRPNETIAVVSTSGKRRFLIHDSVLPDGKIVSSKRPNDRHVRHDVRAKVLIRPDEDNAIGHIQLNAPCRMKERGFLDHEMRPCAMVPASKLKTNTGGSSRTKHANSVETVAIFRRHHDRGYCNPDATLRTTPYPMNPRTSQGAPGGQVRNVRTQGVKETTHLPGCSLRAPYDSILPFSSTPHRRNTRAPFHALKAEVFVLAREDEKTPSPGCSLGKCMILQPKVVSGYLEVDTFPSTVGR